MSDNDEEGLWAYVTKSIKPIEKNVASKTKPSSKLSSKPSKKVQATSDKQYSSKTIKPQAASSENQSYGLDRRTETKLRKGKMPIEGQLDLHGMTQDQAHSALIRFISSSYAAEKRCVIVITGKGRKILDHVRFLDHDIKHKPGVLRQNVPEWLRVQPLSNYVLKAVPAHPRDGGDGALYVYLKRNKN